MKRARSTRAVRLHRGDFLSPETRSAVMARIRGRDTGPELALAMALRARRLRYEAQARDLPGRPDFVFRMYKVAIFVDGRFWHGWGFESWRNKLSEKWEEKIASNIRRDRRNHRKLKRMGWKVVRLWEHQIERDVDRCITKVVLAVKGHGSVSPSSNTVGPGSPTTVM